MFDDMRKDTFKLHELLRILDRYPLQVEYKGGSIPFNSPKIIITSCYHPAKMYETNENIQQLLRRIDNIIEFKCLKTSHPPSVPVSPGIELSKVDSESLEKIGRQAAVKSNVDGVLGMQPLEELFELEGTTFVPEVYSLQAARKRMKYCKGFNP